jgi:hypothetical protein
MSRHNEHFDCGVEIHNAIQELQAGHLRHHQVSQHDVRMFLEDEIQCFLGIGCSTDFQARSFERRGEQFHASGIIIDNNQGHLR